MAAQLTLRPNVPALTSARRSAAVALGGGNVMRRTTSENDSPVRRVAFNRLYASTSREMVLDGIWLACTDGLCSQWWLTGRGPDRSGPVIAEAIRGAGGFLRWWTWSWHWHPAVDTHDSSFTSIVSGAFLRR